MNEKGRHVGTIRHIYVDRITHVDRGRLFICLSAYLDKYWVMSWVLGFLLLQDFLKADEVHHLPKKPAIMNLTNEVIVNKNYLHKDVEVEHQNVEIKPG